MLGFFIKQKTAYEMRISDWSSDVCSSDLCLDCLGDRIGNVVQLQVKKDRQIELRHLHHAVMTVGAEEFETELQAADMIFDRVCKVLRLFKVRSIEDRKSTRLNSSH